MSEIIYDERYFSGECGIYYSVTNDNLCWIRKSEELQWFDIKTKNLIRRTIYDFETPNRKLKRTLILTPASGTFIRLDEP